MLLVMEYFPTSQACRVTKTSSQPHETGTGNAHHLDEFGEQQLPQVIHREESSMAHSKAPWMAFTQPGWFVPLEAGSPGTVQAVTKMALV